DRQLWRRCCPFGVVATTPNVRDTRSSGYPARRQRPSKTGFSLFTKAWTAAAWSAVAPVSVIIEDSKATESSKVWPAAKATERRMAQEATVGAAGGGGGG